MENVEREYDSPSRAPFVGQVQLSHDLLQALPGTDTSASCERGTPLHSAGFVL